MDLSASYSNGFLLVLGIYCVSTLIYCFRIIFEKKIYVIFGLRFAVLGILLHLFFLALHFYKRGYPFLMSSFETLQITSLCILLGFVFLSFFYRFLATGIILIPLSLIFYILSLTHVVAFRAPGHFLANPWAFVHLVFIFLGVAIFMVSFMTGLIYLIQEYRIKHKKGGGFLDRFPPLEILDNIHYRALYTGFICFTIGVISGGGWSKSTLGVYLTNDVKPLLSMAVWVFFAIFLNLRVSRGWKGRRGILLSTIGFLAVIYLISHVQG